MDRSRRDHPRPPAEGHAEAIPRELSPQEIEDLVYADFSGQEIRQIVEDSRALNRIIDQGFGAQVQRSLPEIDAPPIDRELLNRFAASPDSLKMSEFIYLHSCCMNFECWRDARAQAMRDAWIKSRSDGG